MATVTDLTKNSVSATDNSSTQIPEDSNINVYEFGNLILADLLPTLTGLITLVADYFGDLISATDITGASISEEDTSGSSATIADLSGASGSVTDLNIPTVEDSNINVYEFGNVLLAGILPTVLEFMGLFFDLQGSSVSASDIAGSTIEESGLSGVSLTTTDRSDSNSVQYDESTYTYEDLAINYDGYLFTGKVLDISGS